LPGLDTTLACKALQFNFGVQALLMLLPPLQARVSTDALKLQASAQQAAGTVPARALSN
jgi:hypothetical protein